MIKIHWQIVVLITLSFIAGCKKEHLDPPPAQDTSTTELRSGLPDKASLLYGYFFAGYNYNRLSGDTGETITCFAEFCDPSKNLLNDVDRKNDLQVGLYNYHGNVDMGVLHYNGTSLDFSSGYYALNEGPPSLIDQQMKWEVQGTAMIPGFTQNLKNEFPVYKDTIRELQLRSSESFTVNLSDYFDRWDSVVAKIISFTNYYNAYYVVKAGGNKDSVIVFSSKQLDFLPASPGGRLLVRAFRYFHRTIQGRPCVFELSTGVLLTLKISP
jgi:hypothetical protein